MCTSTITLVNPASRIDLNSGQSLFIEVPCGHCWQCLNNYRNEWRNRTFYESLDATLNGRYLYFDTLTYRVVPKLSDYMDIPDDLNFDCFDKSSLSTFIHSLKDKMDYLGYGRDLRYIITSEYGSDGLYYYKGNLRKATLRPHYHCLFFVPNFVPWYVFSKLVSDCWSFGRTDGLPYKSYFYVKDNVFFDPYGASSKACNYVTKYITKDLVFMDKISDRLDALMSLDYQSYLLAKKRLLPCHVQSLGFGNNAIINQISLDVLIESGRFRISDGNKIRHVSLHPSLFRKIGYDHIHIGKRVVHRLNDFGKRYKQLHYNRSLEFARKVNPFLDSSELFDSQYNRFVFRKNKSIDDSFPTYCGLFNYASKSRLVSEKIFTFNDYGNVVDGFRKGFTLVESKNIPLKDGEFITLDNLCKYLVDMSIIIDKISKYKASLQLRGDIALDVEKLKTRLKRKFSNYG